MMKLNIYDKTGKKIVKTYEASEFDLMFGTVKNIFALLKVDKIKDDAELMSTILGAWEEVLNILKGIFPDVKENEWNNVKVKELLPLIIDIVKSTFSSLVKIPTEKN